jgi:1-acyl-sn-glycerol-3-phosphate acyltransferase
LKQGDSVAIVVGGASEALTAHPNRNVIRLAHRKGFIKYALETGTPLVPVYGFGENRLFQQVANPHGSCLRKWQESALKILSISLPFFYGRGIFNYQLGLLPYRNPVYVVVGKPIRVEKVAKFTREQVDRLHEAYKMQLIQLFRTYKPLYDQNGEDIVICE